MKILFVATARSHIGQFHMPFIKCLKEDGHEVHAAFKDNSNDKKGLDLSIIDKTFEVPFERSPIKPKNIKAYFELKKVIKNGNYDIIHCHTPMGAVITRLAAKSARKKGTKVIYTAHGFHFYKGASKKNWLMFYPIEKYLSRYTDALILINKEDYDLSLNKKFKAEKIYKTNGVGVELSKFSFDENADKKGIREELQLPTDMFALIYCADLSVRKNQQMLLKSVAMLKDKIPEIKLLLPGQPILAEEYKAQAKQLGIENNVSFLGYRRDIPKLLTASDIVVSSSRQEGLPINLVEAMAMAKPIVATAVRGNADLVDDNKGGFLVELNDFEAMADDICKLYKDRTLLEKMGEYNRNKINEFSVATVNEQMKNIYREFGCFRG